MSRSSLFDAWTRVGSEMLNRLPEVGSDARKLADLGRAPYRIASEMHEAWLETVGGVSKSRYLAALEENLELRKRLEVAERKANARSAAGPAVEAGAAATGEAIDDAFKQIRDAQEQWMSMWMPGPSGGRRS